MLTGSIMGSILVWGCFLRGTPRVVRRGLVRVALLAWVIAIFLLPNRSDAHAIGVSKGDYSVHGSVVFADTTFARGEILALVYSLDPERSGSITPEALVLARDDIARLVLGRIVVRADGQKCTAKLLRASLTEEDGISIRGRYDCPVRLTNLEIDLDLLDDLSRGHRHLAHVVAGSVTVDEVCHRGHKDIEALVVAPEAHTSTATAGDSLAFVRMGLEHILTGYDHLVFLFGLILVGGRVRSLIGVITAFTIAHSITLALSTLEVWSPSPRFVEPAIALSIAYVGIENFYVRSAEKRWRITFPFGLIHGFGLAGALREIGLPRPQVPAALVLFNVGVEAGQLAVMAIALPLIFWLRKRPWFARYGVTVLSAAVVVVGLSLFFARVRHPQ